MHWFTGLFLFFLALATGLRLYLAQRQINSVSEHRNEVPKSFAEHIELEDHQKAADYSLARVRLGMLDTVIDTLVLLGWTIAGGLSLVLGFWEGLELSPVAVGTAASVSVFFIVSLLSLPLSAYSTFSIEARFGFNRTTAKLFVADLVKSLVLGIAVGWPLATGALWLMANGGSLWWVWVWAGWMGFALFFTWVYPAFIASSVSSSISPIIGRSATMPTEQTLRLKPLASASRSCRPALAELI